MKKILSILLLLGCSMTSQGQEATSSPKPTSFTRLDKIVAIVNREVITQSQLNRELERAKKQFEQSNEPLPPAGELRTKVLDSLIAKNLQTQICKAKNIVATDEDVNKAISNIAKNNKMEVAQLKEIVQQQGMTFDAYKSQLKEQIALQKLQQEEVAKNVTLSPQDVKKFVRLNKNKMNHYNAFHVIDVLMPIAEDATTAQVETVKKQASEVVQQLQQGKPADEILKKYPYAQNTDLGWRALPEMPSLFQEKVSIMTINSVSAPIQAPNGLHILKLMEAKGENASFSETQLKNLAFQQKVSEALKDWIQKQRKDAYIQIMNR